jgi:hypothetical protein
MSSLEIAAWAAASATFLAALVALLKEDLVSLWRRPRLDVRIRLAPPDCHKTEFTLGSARTGEFLGAWPCYYLRVWVENLGNIRAKYVEVFARRLLRKHADDRFKEEPQFLPINLKWSHTGEVILPGISSEMGRFCDIGHVVHPDATAKVGHAISGTAPGVTVFCLDLQVAPNTKTHLLSPGIYRLEIRVAAANSRPVDHTIELTLTGKWFEDQAKMFTDGLGFRRA